jgi:hypothetical protein
MQGDRVSTVRVGPMRRYPPTFAVGRNEAPAKAANDAIALVQISAV